MKPAGLIVIIIALVSLPFAIWGEANAEPLLVAHAGRGWTLGLIGTGLLATDSIAPVPATVVIMFVAAHAGWGVGIVAGWTGLSAGVAIAIWVGRSAVRRIAPRVLPGVDLDRLGEALRHRPALTLACWRSIPVLAEASVILAASAGVPPRIILRATWLPNLVIATVYSLAAEDGFIAGILAFLGVTFVSVLSWWLFAPDRPSHDSRTTP